MLRILAARGENVTHATRIFSDRLRDTVNSAELWWNMAVFSIDLDDEKWLFQVGYLHVIGLMEVLGDTHFLSIMSVKAHGDWSLLEVNVIHDVGFLVAVCANDSFELELVLDSADLILDLRALHDLVNALKACFVGDELVDVVEHNSHP